MKKEDGSVKVLTDSSSREDRSSSAVYWSELCFDQEQNKTKTTKKNHHQRNNRTSQRQKEMKADRNRPPLPL